MKRYFLLVAIFSLTGFCTAYAQKDKGIIEEYKSPLIERLQRERMLLATNPNLSGADGINRPGVPLKTGRKVTGRGYRVQIFSGSNRNDAYSAQARFKQIYKDINTYLNYEQPNYRVKVGDFTSRNQAQALMNQLKREFNTVFIFTETIQIEY